MQLYYITMIFKQNAQYLYMYSCTTKLYSIIISVTEPGAVLGPRLTDK